jgi:hypothetical protein
MIRLEENGRRSITNGGDVILVETNGVIGATHTTTNHCDYSLVTKHLVFFNLLYYWVDKFIVTGSFLAPNNLDIGLQFQDFE